MFSKTFEEIRVKIFSHACFDPQFLDSVTEKLEAEFDNFVGGFDSIGVIDKEITTSCSIASPNQISMDNGCECVFMITITLWYI